MSDLTEEQEEEERRKQDDAERAIILEIQIDRDMLKNLTEEDLVQYDCPVFDLEKPEGNYIEEFDRKVREGSINVSEKFQDFIEEHGVPMRGFDPRTGVYGLKYAAAGFYSAGIVFMERKEWDEAIVNFAKAIELWPRHVPARGLKARCYYYKGDFLRAECEVWNAIDLNPVRLAETDEYTRKFFEGNNSEGKLAYTHTLVNDLLLRSLLFMKDEDYYDEAFSDYNDILKYAPDIISVYHGRLQICMQWGKWEEAIPDANKCIEADYDKVYALESRGISYIHLERYDEAIADLNAAIALNGTRPFAYLNRSTSYLEKKEYGKAIADAEEAIRMGCTSSGYYFRGRAYRESGEYDKAIADFDEALRLYKENDDSDGSWDDYDISYAREKTLKLMGGNVEKAE